jgi:DNA-3-methyladenine glycosylase
VARLSRSFFARPALEVAPDLLGCLLISGRCVGRIVEVEAYLGDGSDPASHSHGGPTARNRSMFGPPGHFYVYRSMGLHWCVNLVCEPEGRAAAVLLRAVEPLAGLDLMRSRRGGRPDRELASGPGRLASAFAIARAHDGASALRGAVRVCAGRPPGAGPILAGPRVGIRKAAHLPYRFLLAGSPFVSRTAQNRRAVPVRRAGAGLRHLAAQPIVPS